MAKPASKASAKPKVIPDEVEVFTDVAQGSAEWFALRRGLCTASRFGTIMANGRDGGESEGRASLLRELAGEILTGETAERFYSEAMRRGNEMEDEARQHYGRSTFTEIAPVGFVRRTIHTEFGKLVVGASPDALVGQDGVLEIKTMRPDLLIELAKKGAAGFPNKHRAQCQGTLWVTGRTVCDLQIFYRGMPVAPRFRVERDDAYIREIRNAVEVFQYELDQLVKDMRAMGAKR